MPPPPSLDAAYVTYNPVIEQLSNSPPAPEAGGGAPKDGGGLLQSLANISSNFVMLPIQFYQYLFAEEPKISPLAERSVLLLLVLLHNNRSPATHYPNQFRLALTSVSDTRYDDAGGSGGGASVPTASAAKLPFDDLVSAFGECIGAGMTQSIILLYTFMQTAPQFLDTLLSRSDLDRVLLPLLHCLYQTKSMAVPTLYVVVIILLHFSQDADFCANIHRRIKVPNVAWFQERLLVNISIGSLLIVVLLRVIQFNMSKLQDQYLYTNCFATLHNLGPQCEELHPYAAQRVVVVLDILCRKYKRLLERVQQGESSSSSSEPSVENVNFSSTASYDENMAALESVQETATSLVQFVSSCLHSGNLQHNKELVYALLHRQDLLEPFREVESMQEMVTSLMEILARFTTKLEEMERETEGILSTDVIMATIDDHIRKMPSQNLSIDYWSSIKNKYEETNDPEIFFVPYIWSLVYMQTSDCMWTMENVLLLNPSLMVTLQSEEDALLQQTEDHQFEDEGSLELNDESNLV